MDRNAFDGLAKLLAAAPSRRAALGALIGTGLAGALGVSGDAAAGNTRKRRKGKRGRRGVSAQAACAPPANGVSRNNCTYDNGDFSGQLIHSSSYKNTTWVDATLVGTDLHASNFKGGSFRRANLCRAKLYSSTLTNVNFSAANLTLADLHSSACGGAIFTASTTFCGTIDCNGNLRNDDCPGANPDDICCSDEDCPGCTVCGSNGLCGPCPGCCDANGGCQPGNEPTACGAGGETCENCPAPEGGNAVCNDDGTCAKTCPAGNPTLCGNDPGTCAACCPGGAGCAAVSNCPCLPTNAGPRDCFNVNACDCVADCANCPGATHVCSPAGVNPGLCGSDHVCCQRCRAT